MGRLACVDLHPAIPVVEPVASRSGLLGADEDAVGDDDVKVDVEVQAAAEALREADGAATQGSGQSADEPSEQPHPSRLYFWWYFMVFRADL